jgi:hypothetical protein
MPTGKHSNDSNQASNRSGSSRHNEKSTATRSAGGRNGDMSVREAGHMGGQRERELVQEGKQAERGGSSGNR